ncbi:hypothetical protein BCR33DRAFT_794203 [Rhizoclosmatium globosum]|uniref:Fungal lipase-type domain-containing protein n=1 Tax=Rhizoclosmatium globosum TaxID=329046 RepID=A0A1Y2AY49_9FUNG|nr:hypothetical protein BCR33DRAFT_794203 [Rhizoclosmatium globosum]|eukprot:ORY26815.1 hypothetical protein BCR33DRAFT_794203 [Rhizoclosmatium globosum]
MGSRAMYRNWVQYQAMVVSEAVYDDEQKRGPDQGVYFHKGDNNSERFLIHVIGTTAFVAFCGTKDQSHFMELQEFELESINEGSELKAMKGTLNQRDKWIPLMVEAFEPSGIKHLVLTGHSRGGSIAFIKLAMYFINPHTNLNSNMVVEAIAFGSPYCFNGPFLCT